MLFPGWLQGFANFLPPFHLAEIALHVVGAKPAASLGISIAALVATTALFLAVAAVGWKRFKES
jgi:ABC-2 type transport system permease protein